jgi:hypothetical protein
VRRRISLLAFDCSQLSTLNYQLSIKAALLNHHLGLLIDYLPGKPVNSADPEIPFTSLIGVKRTRMRLQSEVASYAQSDHPRQAL